MAQSNFTVLPDIFGLFQQFSAKFVYLCKFFKSFNLVLPIFDRVFFEFFYFLMVKYSEMCEKSHIFYTFLQLHTMLIKNILAKVLAKKTYLKPVFGLIFSLTSLAWPNGAKNNYFSKKKMPFIDCTEKNKCLITFKMAKIKKFM